MSLVTVKTSAAATGPTVWMEGPVLCARTSLVWQVLSLGAYRKQVEVDPRARTVTILRRVLWLLSFERVVPFDEISHIEYRFASMATSWSLWIGARDAVESFSISLALGDRSEISLFSFAGEGARMTGVRGVLFGDSVVDFEGDQKDRSLGYLEALMELTGKGLSRLSKPRRVQRP